MNSSLDSLLSDQSFLVALFFLCSGARQRAIYLKQASTELGVNEDVLKVDLGKVEHRKNSCCHANRLMGLGSRW